MTRRALTGATLVVIACVAVTVIEGVPRHLPGVALGSPVLLQAERALAMLAVTVAALSILVQAARGRLPIELSTSGLRYKPTRPMRRLPPSPGCKNSSMSSWRSSTRSPNDSTPSPSSQL